MVDDSRLRDEIMRLRKDPTANALMGGAFTQQNVAVLSSRLGRRPSEGELYIGHFFGPYAGAKAIALAQRDPTVNASTIFPAAARANRSIFYDKQGHARSISQVCAELTRRYQVARAETRPSAAPSVQIAATAAKPVAPVTAALDARRAATVPVSVMAFADRAEAGAAPATSPEQPARADGAGGIFHSLFQAGERREAVAPAISELWGTRTADAARRSAAAPALDLFSDRRPNLRGGLAGD